MSLFGDELFEQFSDVGGRRVVDVERVLIRLLDCLRELKEKEVDATSVDDFLSSRINKGAKSRQRLDAVKRGLEASGVELSAKMDQRALRNVLTSYWGKLDDVLDQQRMPMKRLPKSSVLALWSAIRSIEVSDKGLIDKIAKGKCETVIRDRVLESLHRQMPAGLRGGEVWAAKEVALAGKQIDLVLHPNTPSVKLFVECKMAYAGALGSHNLEAPGLTKESDGLFGDIIKTRRCALLSPMAYLLIVPHFKGREVDLRRFAKRRAAILAQREDRDWESVVCDRVREELSRHPICQEFRLLSDTEKVHVGVSNNVDVSLQFLLIAPRSGVNAQR